MPRRHPDFDRQNKFIKENYADMTAQELADFLGISKETVRKRLIKLGLNGTKDMAKHPDFDKQNEFIKANYPTMTQKEICKVLGIPETTIYSRIARMGLCIRENHTYTIQEVNMLERVYSDTNVNLKELASEIGVTPEALRQKAYILGLKRYGKKTN